MVLTETPHNVTLFITTHNINKAGVMGWREHKS